LEQALGRRLSGRAGKGLVAEEQDVVEIQLARSRLGLRSAAVDGDP
jgi:hypothetical protein